MSLSTFLATAGRERFSWHSIVAAIGLSVSAPALAQQYEVHDLGSLGASQTQAAGLSSMGLATGTANQGTNLRAFVANKKGLNLLGTLGGLHSSGYDVNESGHVVGYSTLGSGEQRAFLWDGVRMQNLGSIGSAPSVAYALNDLDDVVGIYSIGLEWRAFLWTAGSMTDLGASQNGLSVYPMDVNNSRSIALNEKDIFGVWRSYLYRQGVWTDLGTLGGLMTTSFGMNEQNQIVGASSDTSQNWHAFSWRNGVMTDLHLNGAAMSFALDVNERGESVGYAVVGVDNEAFVHRRGRTENLNTLIPTGSPWRLRSATAINERGEILVTGASTVTPNQRHALLLQARLEITALAPARAGARNRIQSDWAEPGASIHFAAGLSPGMTPIGACPGVALDLQPPIFALGSTRASINGRAKLGFPVPASFAGRTVLFQAIEAEACRKADMFSINFR